MTTIPRPRALWLAFVDYVAYCLDEAPVETLELWTSINALLWGAWLANPLMNVFTVVFYGGMLKVAPESAWGLFAMTAASVQLWGRLTGHPRAIRWGGTALAALWMFAAGAIAYQNWRLASIVTYPMMGAASLFVSYRAASVHIYGVTRGSS